LTFVLAPRNAGQIVAPEWGSRTIAGYCFAPAIVARIFTMRGAGLNPGKLAYQRSAEARSIKVFAPNFLASMTPLAINP